MRTEGVLAFASPGSAGCLRLPIQNLRGGTGLNPLSVGTPESPKYGLARWRNASFLIAVALSASACGSREERRELPSDTGLLAVEIGQPGTRRICITNLDDPGRCTSEVANFIVKDLASPAHLGVRWQPDPPDTLEGLVFGAKVVRCRQPKSHERGQLVVRSLPSDGVPPPDQWSHGSVFAQVPASVTLCGEPLSPLPDQIKLAGQERGAR